MARTVRWEDVELEPDEPLRPAPVGFERIAAYSEALERGRRKRRGTAEGTAEHAAALGFDLSRECPVCRSLEPCGCSEAERAYARRIRFGNDVKGVPRCPRDGAPLSTLHVPRPGARIGPLAELSEFGALYACALCQGEAAATVLRAVASLRYRNASGEDLEGASK